MPTYARVRMPGSREVTVLLRDVVPVGDKHVFTRNIIETDGC